MGLETRKYLVCDRCGRSTEVDADATAYDATRDNAGWERTDGDRVLCPDCAPGFDLLLARHKVEIDEYLRGSRPEKREGR